MTFHNHAVLSVGFTPTVLAAILWPHIPQTTRSRLPYIVNKRMYNYECKHECKPKHEGDCQCKCMKYMMAGYDKAA